MIAAELENRLFRLGLKVTASVDHQAQLMRAAGAPKGTVIIAFSHERQQCAARQVAVG